MLDTEGLRDFNEEIKQEMSKISAGNYIEKCRNFTNSDGYNATTYIFYVL